MVGGIWRMGWLQVTTQWFTLMKLSCGANYLWTKRTHRNNKQRQTRTVMSWLPRTICSWCLWNRYRSPSPEEQECPFCGQLRAADSGFQDFGTSGLRDSRTPELQDTRPNFLRPENNLLAANEQKFYENSKNTRTQEHKRKKHNRNKGQTSASWSWGGASWWSSSGSLGSANISLSVEFCGIVRFV